MKREHIKILIMVYTVNMDEEVTVMKLLSVNPNFSLFFKRFFISKSVQLLKKCICVITRKNTVTATFT